VGTEHGPNCIVQMQQIPRDSNCIVQVQVQQMSGDSNCIVQVHHYSPRCIVQMHHYAGAVQVQMQYYAPRCRVQMQHYAPWCMCISMQHYAPKRKHCRPPFPFPSPSALKHYIPKLGVVSLLVGEFSKGMAGDPPSPAMPFDLNLNSFDIHFRSVGL